MASKQAAASSQPKIARDLTSGDVLANVLYMGVPSMIGFAAMTVYALTDMFWVARIGTAEVAGVTLFSSFAFVIGAINSMVGSGSVAVISRRFGERDFAATANAIEQTIVMKFMIGLPMGVAGFFLVGKVLGLMTDDAAVIARGIEYGRVYFLGLPFMFTTYTVYTALRGIADAPRAMYIMLFSVGLNMGLDPLFIFTFGMGVRGAAVATVLSAAIAVAVGLAVLRYGEASVRIRPRGFKFDFPVMSEILRIGGPPLVESIGRSTAFWVLATLVATFGTTVVAAYGISMRIVELGIVFAVGLELGASAIVGQNLGAGKPARAQASARTASLLAFGIAAAISVVELIFAPQILSVFGRSGEVQAEGAEVLRYVAVGQPFMAAAIGLSSAFYGSGHTWPAMTAALASTWVVQIPVMAVCVHVLHLRAPALWLTMIFSNLLLFGIMVVWFRLGRWKHKGARRGGRRPADLQVAESSQAGPGAGFADAD
jgi:putative MATE family efflux protein